MSGLGILASAMAGAASGYAGSMAKSGEKYSEYMIKQEEEKAAEAKAYRVADYSANKSIETADKARKNEASTVTAARDKILNDNAESDPEFDPEDDGNIAKATKQAGIETGYVSTEKAVTMNNSSDMAQMKIDAMMARASDKADMAIKIQEMKGDAQIAAIQAKSDIQKQLSDNGQIKASTARTLIASEDMNIRASMTQMQLLSGQLKDPMLEENQKAPINEQMKSLQADIAASKANKDSYLSQLGVVNTKAGIIEGQTSNGSPTPTGSPNPVPAMDNSSQPKQYKYNPDTGKVELQ